MRTAAAGLRIWMAGASAFGALAQTSVRTLPSQGSTSQSAKPALLPSQVALPPAAPDPPDVAEARKRLVNHVKGTSTLVGRFQLLAGVRPPGGAALHGNPWGVHAGADRNYWNVAGGRPLDATLPAQAGATHAVVVVNGWTDAAHASVGVGGERMLPSSGLTSDVLANGIISGSAVFTVPPGPFKFGFGMNQNGQFGTVKTLGVTSCMVYYFAVR
jgi:hypothetical protein